MFGYDWPRFHAAVNDLPAALLLVTVLFDVAAWLTKRSSLEAAARWTLWIGVIGGWMAVVAGLEAEDAIEHGEAIHELMETHETLALVTMGIFTVVLAWRLIRRARLGGAEQTAVRLLSVAGLVGIVWTARVGGKLVLDHAAEIPAARVSPEIAALVTAESLQVERMNVPDGYVETVWYDTQSRRSFRGTGDVPDLAATVKIRCWADPYVPGQTHLTVETVSRPRYDPSRTERALEVAVPKTHAGHTIADSPVTARYEPFATPNSAPTAPTPPSHRWRPG